MKSIKKILSKKRKNKHNYILTKKKYKSKFNDSNYNLRGGFMPVDINPQLLNTITHLGINLGNYIADKKQNIYDKFKTTIISFVPTNDADYKAIIEYIIDNNKNLFVRAIKYSIIKSAFQKLRISSNINIINLKAINNIINEILDTLDKLNNIINNEIPDIIITIHRESSNTNVRRNADNNVNTLYSIVYNTLKTAYNDFFEYLKNNSENKLNIFYYLIYSIIIQSKLIGIKSPELINIIIYILDIFKQIKVNINSNNSNGNSVNLIDVVRESIIKKLYIDIEDIDTIFLIINIIIDKYKDILCIKTTHHYEKYPPLNLILVLCYSIQNIYINIKDILKKIVEHDYLHVFDYEIQKFKFNLNIIIDIGTLLSLKLYMLINSIDIIPDLKQKLKITNLHINIKDIIKTIILIFFTDNTINYNELLKTDTILFMDNTINYDEIINNITLYDLLKVINAFLNKHNNFIYCIFSIIENILTKQLKDIFKIKINSNNGNSSLNTVLYDQFTKYIKTSTYHLNIVNSDNPNESIYDKLSIEFIITELINIIKSNISHITVEYNTGYNKNNISLSKFVISGINLCDTNNNELSINANQYLTYFIRPYNHKPAKSGGFASLLPINIKYKKPNKSLFGGWGILKKRSQLLSLFNKTIVVKCEFDYLLNNKLTDNSYLLNILLGTNSQVALFLKNIKSDVKIPDNFKLIIIIILNLLKINDDTINKIIPKLDSISVALDTLKNNINTLSKGNTEFKNKFNEHINTFIESIMKIYTITYPADTEQQVFTVDSSDIKKYKFSKLKTLIITRLLNKLQKAIIKLSLKPEQIELYIKLIITVIEYITPIIINIKQIENSKLGDILSLLIGDIFSLNSSNISATGNESEISTHDISTQDNINEEDKSQCENLVHINKATLIGKLYKRLPIIIKKYDIISSLLLFPYNLYKFFKLYEPYNKIYTIFKIAIDANGNPIDNNTLNKVQKKHNKQIIEIYTHIIDTVYNYYYYVFSYIIYNTNTVTNNTITTPKSYNIIINLKHNDIAYKLKINFKNIKLVNNTFSSNTSSGISSSDITITIDKLDQSIIDIGKLTELLKTIFKLNLDHAAIKSKKIELLKLTLNTIKNTNEENIEFLKKILFEYSYGIYSDYFDNHSIDKVNNNKHIVDSCINNLTYYTPCTIPIIS